MFSEAAFLGYNFKKTSCCRRDETHRVIGSDLISGSYDRCGVAFNISRVAIWNALLKNMEFTVTPDVVSAYCIATCQSSVINNIIWGSWDLCESVSMYHMTGPSGIGQGGDGTTIDIAYEPRAHYQDSDNHGFGVPVELMTMTREYMFDRAARFARIIQGSISSAINWKSCLNVTLPNKIINALNSGFATGSSLSEVIGALETFHATIMPSALDYSLNGTCQKWASLKWDGAASSIDGHRYGQSEYCDSTATNAIHAAKITELCSLVNHVYEAFVTACEENNVDKANQLAGSYAMGNEILLYLISALTGDYYGIRSIRIPNIEYANKMYLKSKIDDSNPATDNHDRYVSPNAKQSIAGLLKFSPAGILTLGDMLDCTRIKYNYCRAAFAMIARCKLPEYDCVASFINYEIMQQIATHEEVRNMVKRMRDTNDLEKRDDNTCDRR